MKRVATLQAITFAAVLLAVLLGGWALWSTSKTHSRDITSNCGDIHRIVAVLDTYLVGTLATNNAALPDLTAAQRAALTKQQRDSQQHIRHLIRSLNAADCGYQPLTKGEKP